MTYPVAGGDDRDRLDVVVVGSVNLDLVASTHRIPAPGETVLGTSYAEHPGGKGLNQAVACARSGARTAMLAAVGDDGAGERLRSVMVDAGIGTDGVGIVAGTPTGRAIITVAGDGENSIVVVPGANHHLADTIALPAAAVVLAQLEIPHATVAAAFAQAAAFDAITVLNPSPAAPLDPEMLRHCDIVVPNEHEVDRLGGAEALLSLLRPDRSAVIVTRGRAGADIHTADGTWNQPAFTVTPVDTTGAGDSFCGALVARLAAGDDLATAVRWAAAAGALATTGRGAVPSIPQRAAIEELIAAAS